MAISSVSSSAKIAENARPFPLQRLPSDVSGLLPNYLNALEIARLATASRGMRDVTVKWIQNKPVELKQFIDDLISKLDKNANKGQIEALNKILSDHKLLVVKSVDQDLPLIKNKIIKVLETLDEAALDKLKRVVCPYPYKNAPLIAACNRKMTLVNTWDFKDIVIMLAKAGETDLAIGVARLIMDTDIQGSALLEVTKSLAQAGKINRAIEVAKTIKEKISRNWAFVEIVKALVKEGEISRAVEMGDAIIEDPLVGKLRSFASNHIVNFFLEIKEEDGLIKAAKTIANTTEGQWILSSVVSHLASAGEINKATKVMDTISNQQIREDAVRCVAIAWARAGNFEKAIKEARTIQEQSWREACLTEIVKALVEGGKMERAIEVANSIQDKQKNGSALQQVVQAFAKAGEYGKATEIANRIQDKRGQSFAFLRIVTALAEAGKIEEAAEQIKAISEEDVQGRALLVLVIALTKAGEIEEAIKRVNAMPAKYRQEDAFLKMSTVLAEARKFDKALEIAHGIQGDGEIEGLSNKQSRALKKIVEGLAKVGEPDRAIKEAKRIKNQDFQGAAFQEIVKALVKSGKIEKATEVAKNISNEYYKANSLAYIKEAQPLSK